jgi:hypothetical protein
MRLRECKEEIRHRRETRNDPGLLTTSDSSSYQSVKELTLTTAPANPNLLTMIFTTAFFASRAACGISSGGPVSAMNAGSDESKSFAAAWPGGRSQHRVREEERGDVPPVEPCLMKSPLNCDAVSESFGEVRGHTIAPSPSIKTATNCGSTFPRLLPLNSFTSPSRSATLCFAACNSP